MFVPLNPHQKWWSNGFPAKPNEHFGFWGFSQENTGGSLHFGLGPRGTGRGPREGRCIDAAHVLLKILNVCPLNGEFKRLLHNLFDLDRLFLRVSKVQIRSNSSFLSCSGFHKKNVHNKFQQFSKSACCNFNLLEAPWMTITHQFEWFQGSFIGIIRTPLQRLRPVDHQS